MKKRFNRFATAGLAAALAAGMLGGSNAAVAMAAETEIETVNWYQWAFIDYKQEAVERVESAVNEILGERYGINVNMVYLSIGDFVTQVNLALASDEVDVVTAINGFMSLYNLVDNGQVIALDDYLANASDEMKSALTEDEIAGMTMHDQLYYLNRKYLVGGEIRLIMDEAILEEVGYSASDISTYDDIDELFAAVHEAHPEIYTVVPQTNNVMTVISWLTGDDLSGGNGIVDLPADGSDVCYTYENPLFKEWCEHAYKWYQAGYILPDVLSNTTSGGDYLKAGRAFSFFANGDIYNNMEEGQVYATVLGEPRILASGYTNVGYAISTNSKHKDASWKLLEAMYTDAEVSNLLVYGVEGEDYVVQPDGTVNYPEGVDSTSAAYTGVSQPYLFPNYQILYPTSAQGPDYIANVDKYNAAAQSTPAVGFVWDTTGHTDAITACAQVKDKYYIPLLAGMVDPETMIPKAVEELEYSGGAEILESVKEQYDAFLANE